MTSSSERTSVNDVERGACANVESRKLSVCTDASSSSQEIHQDIPNGLEIKPVSYGYGIFATKSFCKGSTVYVGQQIVIPNRYAQFRLILDNREGAEFNLNTDTHSVQFNDHERWLYLFDSFMNHSDDPTTISRQNHEQRLSNTYETVALRDIKPGDEITCDYNLFEYDCHGKVIDECLCNADSCVGRVAGYRFLSIMQQKARIQLVDQEVLVAMGADVSNKFYYIPDLGCPLDRVRIESTSGNPESYRLMTTRAFVRGEIVYSNKSLIFPEDWSIVIELNTKRIWLDKLVHTVNKGNGYREFYFFDSFQNHSCDPNTIMIYHDDQISYDIVAARDIEFGEELTSDYETFDDGLDGTSFHCRCGSSNCRNVINA
jgi:hypothetical protein